MQDSILKTIRVRCGLVEDDDSFDPDIIPLINAELMTTVTQLGVGTDSFEVSSELDTWDDFNYRHPELNGAIASLVGIRVKLIFDPPTSSMALTALTEQASRLEWRINVAVDPE